MGVTNYRNMGRVRPNENPYGPKFALNYHNTYKTILFNFHRHCFFKLQYEVCRFTPPFPKNES
jgi:hypothetical protein